MQSFKKYIGEASVTPGDLKAQAEGKKAARKGQKYDQNPYEKGSSRHLQWSKGHNAARAGMLKKEEVELDEGKYVGGPAHTWPEWIGGINSKKAKAIKDHLTKKGHAFKDHSEIAGNKKDNTHHISMHTKEGHAELEKIKKKHGLGHYPYGTPGHNNNPDHKGKADKADLPLHVNHDPKASYMKEEAELNEAAGYKATSEKSQFGGHRAHLKNPDGKTSYMGAAGYKKPEHAKGEAQAYHDAYFGGPGKANERAADRAVAAYRAKHKEHMHVKESVDLDESEINELTAQYINENNISVEQLENMTEEELNELIGKAIGGAFKVGAKAAVGAARLAGKAAKRMSTSGRADAAEKKADSMEKKNKDRERIKAAQDRLRKAKEAARNK